MMTTMMITVLMRITVLIMLMTNFGGRTIQHLHDQLCCDHNDLHDADDCNDYISLIIIVIVYLGRVVLRTLVLEATVEAALLDLEIFDFDKCFTFLYVIN